MEFNEDDRIIEIFKKFSSIDYTDTMEIVLSLLSDEEKEFFKVWCCKTFRVPRYLLFNE
jgi:hypothetical protein